MSHSSLAGAPLARVNLKLGDLGHSIPRHSAHRADHHWCRYWEVDDDVAIDTGAKLPYRIEVVGVTCEPGLAVARGIWRQVGSAYQDQDGKDQDGELSGSVCASAAGRGSAVHSLFLRLG